LFGLSFNRYFCCPSGYFGVKSVELSGRGDLDALVREVDRIAEIPNTLRRGTPVSLRKVRTSG
jgi:hypothetical protein